MTKLTFREFYKQCKKTPPRIYYTWAYHQISYPLSYLMYRLGMSPNSISLTSIALNFVGAYLIIFQFEFLWGVVIFLASYIVDCCDGNVARIEYQYLRIRNMESKVYIRGMAYENLNTNLSNFLFFISLGYYFSITQDSTAYLYLAIAAFGVKIMSRYSSLHISLLKRDLKAAEENEEDKQLFKPTVLNEIKFFFARILNSTRAYFVLFILAALFIPQFLSEFYVIYFVLILFLSLAKLLLTFIRVQP